MTADNPAGLLAQELNLGSASAQWLVDAGFTTFAQVEALGSVQTYVTVRSVHPECSANLLYALEGALQGVRWDLLPKDERAALRSSAVEAAQREIDAAR